MSIQLSDLPQLPRISSYGDYQSRSYGLSTLHVELGLLEFYFSYQTLVAFQAPFQSLVVHQNDFSRTTGKHLNWIDGGRKRDRVNGEEFARRFQETMPALQLVQRLQTRLRDEKYVRRFLMRT